MKPVTVWQMGQLHLFVLCQWLDKININLFMVLLVQRWIWHLV